MGLRKNARWTQDTLTAFLLALRLHGTVRLAAAAVGRDASKCYDMRKRDPEFRTAWDRIAEELAAARRTARADAKAAARGKMLAARDEARSLAAAGRQAGRVAARDASGNRRRWSGLSEIKRRAFLRTLSQTGTVATACRVAGVSDTIVYRARSQDADFATAWERALAVSGPVLEQVAWERAVQGWEEDVWHAGRVVGTRRRHDGMLLRWLLAHGPGAEGMRRGGGSGRGGGYDGGQKPWESDREFAARERAAGYPGGRPGYRKDGRAPGFFVSAEETDAELRKVLDRVAARMRHKRETPEYVREQAAEWAAKVAALDAREEPAEVTAHDPAGEPVLRLTGPSDAGGAGVERGGDGCVEVAGDGTTEDATSEDGTTWPD